MIPCNNWLHVHKDILVNLDKIRDLCGMKNRGLKYCWIRILINGYLRAFRILWTKTLSSATIHSVQYLIIGLILICMRFDDFSLKLMFFLTRLNYFCLKIWWFFNFCFFELSFLLIRKYNEVDRVYPFKFNFI